MNVSTHAAIIIVDDEIAIRDLLTRLIQRFFPRHSVYTCSTTAQALAYAAQHPIACVLTDYDLGRENGDTLALTLHTHWPDLPIILLSGLPHDDDELSATHYVARFTKPIALASLRDILCIYLTPPLG